MLGPDDHEPAKTLAKTFIEAVRQANFARLKDIVRLCELHETKTYGDVADDKGNQCKRDPIPWHYYAGIVSCRFLKGGTVPTKKAVKEAALRERAITEAPGWEPGWAEQETVKISEDDPNWGEEWWASKRQRKKRSVQELRKEQIDKKIEQLRPLQPKNWTRIFRDLGLGGAAVCAYSHY